MRAARWQYVAAAAMALAVVLFLGMSAATSASISIHGARAELEGLIDRLADATAFRYGAADDLGRSMDTADIVWISEAGRFAAVYHTPSGDGRTFLVQLATSTDLLTWTWQATLATSASQATLARASDGGYVAAWEQAPDPIHIQLAWYPSWRALLEAAPAREFSAPITTPACGEGTPSIEGASSRRVDLTFHYHADCARDREAKGSTDWRSWRAQTRPSLDRALQRAGAAGLLGDRDEIEFEGHDLMLVEGQLQPNDPGSWRTFLYDGETGQADPLAIRTHGGSRSFSNPTISEIRINDRAAILVTLYLFTEGAAPGEAGELIYYRTMRP